MNPLRELHTFGQSPWLDDLRRTLVQGGELRRLIDEDGVRGLTSNPAIFEKAIAQSSDYDDAIRSLSAQGKSVTEIYETLTIEDVQAAADLFRPLFDESGGEHGFVSYEVSPHLALDTEGTLKEARSLWERIDRPNVMIKVPATEAGLPAIRTLISEGINVNVTLIFGLPRYRKVAEAYIAGLRDRADRGESVAGIASVASFFLSRIDVLFDPMLQAIASEGGERGERARGIIGEVAIASAKVAYEMYGELFGAPFEALRAQGAKPQRLLWASTGTKNPEYSRVKYVEPLIGPDTVNTMPQETLDAYREEGRPAARLTEGVDKAHRVLDDLKALGISLDEGTQRLEDEGITKFTGPFDSLMETLAKARDEAVAKV
jgi:transaldolase